MKTIIKNKSNLGFLSKNVESLARDPTHAALPSREILILYRDVLKMTRRFTWANEDGQSWREILERTARQEFEMIRNETDQVKLSKFVITWRDAVFRIHEKINGAQMKMMEHVDASRTDREAMDKNDYYSPK